MKQISRFLLASAAVLMAAGGVWADSVSLGPGGSLDYNDAKINKIEGDEIFFTTSSGTETHKTISDRLRITIVGEPALNAAEAAFATQKWSDAADGYQKTLTTTNRSWLKDYAAARLQQASEKAGRFDAAVSAWIYLVQKNMSLAVKTKPAPPPNSDSAYIKTAEGELEAAVTTATGDDVRQALLTYELDLARYQKDDATLASVSAKLMAMGAISPSTLLELIRADIDAKRYPAAKQKLDQIKTPLTDPAMENERLFCQSELAYFTAPATMTDAAAMDLAIDFMRVYTDDRSGELAPTALLRAAELHEKFHDAPKAVELYTQIAKDYANSPQCKAVVDEANKNLNRLKGNS